MRPRFSDRTLHGRIDPSIGWVLAMVTASADADPGSLRLAGMSWRQDTPWPSFAVPQKSEWQPAVVVAGASRSETHIPRVTFPRTSA